MSRTQEACENEIESVEEYAGRVLGIEVDYLAFRAQVLTIIERRIDDFIFQRFRDWPIKELLMLEGALQKKIKAQQKEEPKRGRPAKKQEAAQHDGTV